MPLGKVKKTLIVIHIMATLATIGCAVFVFIALGLDVKKNSLRLHLMIPLLWMMNMVARPVSFWLNPSPEVATEMEDLVSGDPINRNFLIILMVLGLFIVVRRRALVVQAVKNNRWVIILFLYMGLSTLWSDYQDVSFKRWVRELGNLTMVFIVATEQNLFETITLLIRRAGIILIPLSVVLIKYVPDIGRAYTLNGLAAMWVGVTPHKNGLGQLCLVCGFCFLVHLKKLLSTNQLKKIKLEVLVNSLLLLMVFWILKGSGSSESKTAILVFLFGMVTYVGLGYMKNSLKNIGYIIAFIVIGVVILQLSFDLFQVAVAAAGRDMTLTGRVPLWQELLRMGALHPFIGYGYGGFWLGAPLDELWRIFVWKPEQAHNGYISIYLDLGMWGLMLMLCMLYAAYKNILVTSYSDFDYSRFRLSFFMMILLYNITEGTLLKAYNFLWFIFLLVIFFMPQTISHGLVEAKKPVYRNEKGAISSA